MQISCEKCSATYDLDERMLSPTGTPVQCTRCQQIFMAKPRGASAAPAQMLPDLELEIDAADEPEPATQVAQLPIPPPAAQLPPSALEPSRVTQIYGRPAGSRASSSSAAPALSVSPSLGAPSAVPGPEVTTSMKVARDRATTVELPRLAKVPDLPDLGDETPLARLGAPTEPSMPRSGARRASSANMFVGLGMALILAAGGGLYFLRKRTGGMTALREQEQRAWAMLRADDAVSRGEARRALEGLIATQPELLRARADLLSLVVVDLDEAKWEAAHLGEEASRLAREISELREARSPLDWEVRANALDAELAELRIRHEPQAARVRSLMAEADRMFNQLAGQASAEGPEGAAWIRAQALYHAVRGEEASVALARAYRSRPPPEGQDGWGEVALAEFALNAPAPGTARRQAVEELWNFRSKDTNFLRIQVLSGRLALQQGDLPLAQKALEAVVALNPKHRFAAEVLGVAQESAAQEAGEPDR